MPSRDFFLRRDPVAAALIDSDMGIDDDDEDERDETPPPRPSEGRLVVVDGVAGSAGRSSGLAAAGVTEGSGLGSLGSSVGCGEVADGSRGLKLNGLDEPPDERGDDGHDEVDNDPGEDGPGVVVDDVADGLVKRVDQEVDANSDGDHNAPGEANPAISDLGTLAAASDGSSQTVKTVNEQELEDKQSVEDGGNDEPIEGIS